MVYTWYIPTIYLVGVPDDRDPLSPPALSGAATSARLEARAWGREWGGVGGGGSVDSNLA